VPDLLDDRLRDLIAPPDPEAALAGLHTRARRRRTARRAASALVVVLVLGAAGAVAVRATGGDETTDVHVGPTTDDGEAGWSDLPMPPVVSITGAAWAEDVLVAWGPTEEGALEDQVFGLDDATSTWRPLRPGSGVQAETAVWTGEQMVFLSDEPARGVVGATDAPAAPAWSPSTDSWDTVSTASTPCADSPTWTGTYVVTGCPTDGTDGQPAGALTLFRLDLEEGTWAQADRLTQRVEGGTGAPALARLGDDVVVVGYVYGPAPTSFGAFLYDPAIDEWGELPGGPVPLATSDGVVGGFVGVAVTPTSDGLLVVSADRTSARYIGAEQRWEQLGEIPTRSTICLPSVVLAGDTAVADLCSGVAALGPDGTWTTTAYASSELYGNDTQARWLASDDTALGVGSSALERYRPPAPDADGQIPFGPVVPLDDALLEVPDGAEVRSVEIVVPELAPNEDVFTYEEQLQAEVVLADHAACTITTGAADSRGVGIEVHGIEGSLSQSAEGSTVRWSWTPDTAWHQVQVTCPTDAQALGLAEHVVYPALPDIEEPPTAEG
jgi:hypothetical protein